jgi:hypothetical protein
MYDTRLAELTFNSKPIINDLTRLAEQNRAYAERVAECVHRRISCEGVGERRMPFLYLTDSILKNVGGVYFAAFYPNMVEDIATTYALVPPDVKERIIHLLRTWVDRTLFSASTMQKLQARLGRTIEPTPRPAPTAVSTVVPPPLYSFSSSSSAAAAAGYGRGGAPPPGGNISAAVVPVHPLHAAAAAAHHGSCPPITRINGFHFLPHRADHDHLALKYARTSISTLEICERGFSFTLVSLFF